MKWVIILGGKYWISISYCHKS